ncbi:rhodanese/Cell cycle control phosphatase superfamily protein isoform X2 [Carex rostrata]
MAKFTSFRPQILLSPRLSFLSPHRRPQRFFSYSSPKLSLSLVCSSLPNPSPIDFSHLPSAASERDETLEDEFLVINFYKFVSVKDPQEEVTKQLDFLQYSGPRNDAIAYVEFLRKDPRFSDILVQTSPALNRHAFPRLKLRYKPSLVQMEGGISNLPVLDPGMRATPLSPSEWKQRLQEARNINATSSVAQSSGSERTILLLDVRNGYEWDIGHFEGAERPIVNSFRSTSVGLSDQEVCDSHDPLTGVDKEKTDILMYCTGGIRCDVYSTVLRREGFKNLYTLSGGVSNYLKTEGPTKWVGNLFVFDSRLALPPVGYQSHNKVSETGPQPKTESTVALGKCYICGSHLQHFMHRNCANLDCNLLFLCCVSCLRDLRGCCSLDCTVAPRLRPVLPAHQRYEKWHVYRDGKFTKEMSV